MPKRIPSHRLHKPSGRGFVRLAGKNHYTGKFGTQEAEAAYRRILSQWNAGSVITGKVGSGPTMAMVIAAYLDHCESYYPKKFNSEYEQAKYALRWLVDYLDTPAADFSPSVLKSVRNEMLKAKDRRRKHLPPEGLSRSYINKMVDRIVRMFSWAAEEELVCITVYQALKNVAALKKGRCSAKEAPKVQPVSDTVVNATLPFLSPVVADMVRVQRLCGMRPGEVCCLTPSMIDRRNQVWVADLPEHKTSWRGKDRLIYIGPKAQAILTPYLLRGPEAPLFSPRESEAKRRAAIERNTPTNQGNRAGYNKRTRAKSKAKRTVGDEYSTQAYGRAIQYAIKKAAKNDPPVIIPTWSANQLRHAAATEIRKLFGLEGAQVVLGHASRQTTERYAERVNGEGVQIAAAIG